MLCSNFTWAESTPSEARPRTCGTDSVADVVGVSCSSQRGTRIFLDSDDGGDGRVGDVVRARVRPDLASGAEDEQPAASTIDVTTPTHVAFPAPLLTSQVFRSATVAMTSASMAITNVAFANVDGSSADMGGPPFEIADGRQTSGRDVEHVTGNGNPGRNEG